MRQHGGGEGVGAPADTMRGGTNGTQVPALLLRPPRHASATPAPVEPDHQYCRECRLLQGRVCWQSTLAAPSFGMDTAADFTAYDTPGSSGTRGDCTPTSCGSPRHPSFPVMHSAASSASLYLPLVLKLNTAQITELRKLDFAVATSRTFAGVHYPTDNRAGLNIGHEVLAKQLPGVFASQFGRGSTGKAALEANVKQELETLAYDWREHQACTSAQCADFADAWEESSQSGAYTL